MNERIRELAEQANIEFTYDPTETPMRAFAECWEDDLEKFAELIVRECGVALSPMLRDMISRGQAYDLIKEHFRVEE
jgi:predicted hydrolase (HD superfamily)